MTKALYISLIVASTVFARENPFFSTDENLNLPMTSNKGSNKPPLTSMTYNFPDQARVLKEATFTFQNADGSLETRKIEIDQSIDWHNPLVLTQYGQHQQNSVSPLNKSSNANNGFIQFTHSGNQISLLTNDPVMRSFSLADPNTLIIDFVHTAVFSPYEKNLDASPYAKVKVTYHKQFARVTLSLDGRYTCKVSKTSKGASVICK
jgi:hypothetical protein